MCTCKAGAACGDPGKHPRITNYMHEGTTNRGKIEGWARRWPGCNWGMCPSRAGEVVVDPDRRNYGFETLEAMDLTPESFETPRVITGDGIHWHFGHPARSISDGTIGLGIDLLVHRNVILAGSLHWSGIRYAWAPGYSPADVNLAPFPQAFLDALLHVTQKDADEHRRTQEPPPLNLSVSICVPFSDRIELATKSTLPSAFGQRFHSVFKFARYIKAIFPDATMSELRAIVKQWHAAALEKIRTKEFEQTWIDFVEGWKRIKYPVGKGPLSEAMARADAIKLPPAIAELYADEPEMLRAAKLCAELQRRAGAEPFYLAVRSLADLLGIERMAAHRRLKVLNIDRVIVEIEKGKLRRASTYRWAGGNE
ncbi:MAG: bifunctional DNA primase/polymerase [Tepidisphaeraceae bacterium]